MKLLVGCMTMVPVRTVREAPPAWARAASSQAPKMRGRSICRPDWLSIAAPGFTSMATRRRWRGSGIHGAPVGHLGQAGVARALRCTGSGHPARRARRARRARGHVETGPLLARPRVDRRTGVARVARHRLRARRRHRELEADAVRVEKVDRFDDVVVGDADHFHAGRVEPRLRLAQRLDRIDAQGNVVDPRRRVRRRIGRDVVAEVEEGKARAVGHAKEDVHIGAVLARARHPVGADHVHEGQAEHVFVEGSRFLAVAAAPGEVMKAADGNEGVGHWGDSGTRNVRGAQKNLLASRSPSRGAATLPFPGRPAAEQPARAGRYFLSVRPWSNVSLTQRSLRLISRIPPLPSLRITYRVGSQPGICTSSMVVATSVLVTIAGTSSRRQASTPPATMRKKALPSFSCSETEPTLNFSRSHWPPLSFLYALYSQVCACTAEVNSNPPKTAAARVMARPGLEMERCVMETSCRTSVAGRRRLINIRRRIPTPVRGHDLTATPLRLCGRRIHAR